MAGSSETNTILDIVVDSSMAGSSGILLKQQESGNTFY